VHWIQALFLITTTTTTTTTAIIAITTATAGSQTHTRAVGPTSDPIGKMGRYVPPHHAKAAGLHAAQRGMYTYVCVCMYVCRCVPATGQRGAHSSIQPATLFQVL